MPKYRISQVLKATFELELEDGESPELYAARIDVVMYADEDAEDYEEWRGRQVAFETLESHIEEIENDDQVQHF